MIHDFKAIKRLAKNNQYTLSPHSTALQNSGKKRETKPEYSWN